MVVCAALLPVCAFAATSATVARKPTRTPVPTVQSRMAEMGERVRGRLRGYFRRRGVSYPPARVSLVALKKERVLQVYAPAPDGSGDWRFICEYPITALSGKLGPKLREGDMQVPEGIYRVTFLNPGSKFHVSLALDYPNTFDREQARREKRKNLGGEIMIHGSWFSEGCIALGDSAAEDLFVLSADVKASNMRVVIAPVDFRKSGVTKADETTGTRLAWTGRLYEELKTELKKYDDLGTTEGRAIVYADAKAPVYVPAGVPEKPELATSLLGLFMEALVAAAEDAATTSTR